MEEWVKHWSVFSRQYPSPCTVEHLDYIRGKDHWIDRAFQSCNFSFILKGSGQFCRRGQIFPIQAPCVITQWPGDRVAYGPPRPMSTWDELYLMYGKECQDSLRARGFFRDKRRVWSISNMKSVWPLIEELTALAASAQPERAADRVDSICDRMILESLLPMEDEDSSTEDAIMSRIASYLQEQLDRRHDIDQIAEQHGYSVSAFRRHWLRKFHVPPSRYILNLRIQNAKKLLSETRLSVAQIAEACGFEDALYFSRRFHIESKASPSEYRRKYGLF